MTPKCFGCGKFLKIGMGTITRVKRFDGEGDQYFCEECVSEREQWYSREEGRPVTFQEHWRKTGDIEVV